MTLTYFCRSLSRICRLLIIASLGIFAGCRSIPPEYSSSAIDEAIMPDFRREIDLKFSRLFESGKLTAPEQLLKDLPEQTSLNLTGRPLRRPKKGNALYNHIRESTVMVGALHECRNPDCPVKVHFTGGAGVFITDDGVVATNYHVIKETDRLGYGIATRNGECYPVTEVLAVSKDIDIAILKTTAVNTPPLPLVPYSPPGTPVIAVGHPNRLFYVYSEGAVTGYFPRRLQQQPRSEEDNGQSNAPFSMGISADFAKGSSGGPVVDHFGRITGLAQSTRPVYHIEKEDERELLQMVHKLCVPAHHILEITGNLKK